MNEIKTRKTILKISETKSWFFGKKNKKNKKNIIGKPLAKLRKKKTQINKIRN